MKIKRKRQIFVFRSIWSNHPEGRNAEWWEDDKEPPSKYFSDRYNEYLPEDYAYQTPGPYGYYVYPDGTKVKIEEFGDIPAPYGEYTKKVYMIFYVNA